MSVIGGLKCAVFPATTKHTATVIFSHGLGDTAAGWTFLAKQLGPSMPHVKWIMPTAPVQPVTINGGMRMNSYDVRGFEPNSPEDETGMEKSMKAINDIVDQEVKAGVPSERVVVGGFSQGGVISLLVGTTTARRLAGIVVLSGWAALRNKTPQRQKPEFKDIPVLWGHGTDDPLVLFATRAVPSVDFLKKDLKMTDVRFESYQGLPHSVSMEELEHVAEFFTKHIPNADAGQQKM